MKRPLFIICGPTATGKTALSFSLAKQFQGELVSADSRQVYRNMTIGTGKDLPESSPQLPTGAYLFNDTFLWGYDLVSPLDSFSVSQYLLFAREIVTNIWQRNHTPILVGGTGFYIKSVLDGLSTAHIPPDRTLRDALSSLTPEELYTKLSVLDPEKANSLNSSDKKNPLRLIRAIEVSQSAIHSVSEFSDPLSCSPCFIGLTASLSFLKHRITSRVNERFMQNMEHEVRTLLSKGLLVPGSQSASATGYFLWIEYLNGQITKETLREKWILQEFHYAKRQLTWFKKDSRIHWFSIEDLDYANSVAKFAFDWYNS